MGIKNREIKNRILRKCLFNFMKRINIISDRLGFRLYDTRIRQLKPRKIYSDTYEFIYIENPLSASQSIIKSIYLDKNNRYESKSCRDWSNISRSKLKNYTIFTVKRNPWNRIVSCYNKKILNAYSPARMAILAQYSGLYPQMSFKEFAGWLCSQEGSDENSDKHWTSQYKIIYEMNPIEPDIIVDINNLDGGIRYIFESMGVFPPKLGRHGESTNQYSYPIFDSNKKYFERLNNKQILNIEKRYKKDCDILGYDYLREWL